MQVMRFSWPVHICLDNEIGDQGGCALAESLKQNMALAQLNLFSMLEISV
jgi:hypothetical protein